MFDFLGVQELLSSEEREIQRSARRFLEAEALPHISSWWEAGEFPRHLIPKFAEMGFLGPTIPSEYGGAGPAARPTG